MREDEEIRGFFPELGFQLGLEKWVEFCGERRIKGFQKGKQRPEHILHINETVD